MRYIYLLLTIFAFSTISCEDVKVGYLSAHDAEYIPNSMVIKRIDQLQGKFPWEPDYQRVQNNSPWVTLKIEKVKGTAPILYEILNITSPDGGDVAAFREKLNIRGVGIMQLPLQHGVKSATYVVSIRIKNESYHQDLIDAYTFIVN